MRVDFEDLEPSDDYLILTYDGKPFTGVAFETDGNGKLISEVQFKEGQKSGLSREWTAAGVLYREQSFGLNALHGPSREWYENGAIKTEAVYELGICLRERSFSPDGAAIRDFVLEENSPQFKTLKLLRESALAGAIKGAES